MPTQIPLGEKFYLFASDGDFDPQEVHLLISAHGGYNNLWGPFGGSHITLPAWTQLHFYAAHGAALADPTVYGIIKGDYQVSETKGSGATISNYGLSKYQGRHGSADETYASIARQIDQNAGVLSDVAEGRNKTRNFGFRFDVLTVRNRRFKKSPSLQDALAALSAAGREYENIHCSFCRSKIFGRSPTETATGFGS